MSDPTSTAIETLAGERFSYADLMALSGRLAMLVALGVQPGDRVSALG